MLIPSNQIQLTDNQRNELISFVTDVWRNGYAYTKMREWINCSDAYHLVFRKPLSDSASYLNDYRVYYPIARTLCDVGTKSMTAYMVPSTKYLNVKRALVGEFITNAILQNFAEVNWISDTDETVLQAGQCGDTFTIEVPQGPFLRLKPISLHGIRVAPLDKDISKITKVMLLRKAAWDLERSQIEYIAESVIELKKLYSTKEDYRKGSVSQVTTNPYSNSEETTLGTGVLLLEAHIPYFKCSDGTEYSNIIVTIAHKEKLLVRFSQQVQDINDNQIFKTAWQPVTPGEYWSEGIIAPCLSSNAAINTQHTAQTFGALVTNMNGVQYNYNDKLTRQLAEKWVARPLAKWPVTPQSNLAPIPLAEKGLTIERTIGMMQQYLYEMVDGRGGNNLATPFSIDKNSVVSQQRIALGQTRAAQLAKHWDRNYIRECAFRTYKYIYNQMFPNSSIQGANIQAIQFWFKKSGFTDRTIMEKLNDKEFMEELSINPELTEIEATGTQSQIDKEEQSQNLITLNRELAQTPSGQYVKWDKMGRRIAQTLGLNNVDELFFTQEEQDQMQQEQQAGQQDQGGQPSQGQVQQLVNIIEGGVNPQTGEPLTEDQISQLKEAYQEMTGQSYDQEDANQGQPEVNPQQEQQQVTQEQQMAVA